MQNTSTNGGWSKHESLFSFGENRNIVFKDGTSIEVSENVHPDVFATKKVLAELAKSKKQWEQWVSFEEESFYDLYTRWFGPPKGLLKAQAETIRREPPTKFDFLKYPYDRNDSCGIGGYFDHEHPQCDDEPASTGNKVLLFTRQERDNSADANEFYYH